MKMNFYKTIIIGCMMLFFVQPLHAQSIEISGPDSIEAPHTAEGYEFYSCPDGYSFDGLTEEAYHMQSNGTLVLLPAAAGKTVTLTARNSQGDTITKTIKIQESWVITQHADTYKIPDKTTDSQLQKLDALSQETEVANYIRISSLLVGMLLFYMFIYIHHKIRGGDY